MGNRPLFKQREKQYKTSWAPKVPGHSGEAHTAQKAEAELRRRDQTKKAEAELRRPRPKYEG